MEIRPHIKVVQHPNSSVRSFHFVQEVCNTRHMWGFGDGSLGSIINDRKADPGELAKTLSKRLLALPGVTGGHFRRYELSVTIADAFRYKDLGPLIMGEIIKAVYPELNGHALQVSTQVGWSYYVRPFGLRFSCEEDDGRRIRYVDVADHQEVEVKLGSGRPIMDIEELLGVASAKEIAAREEVIENA